MIAPTSASRFTGSRQSIARSCAANGLKTSLTVAGCGAGAGVCFTTDAGALACFAFAACFFARLARLAASFELGSERHGSVSHGVLQRHAGHRRELLTR